MVNAGKEFADVAFENVGGSGVVVGDFSCIRFKLLYGFMGSFVIWKFKDKKRDYFFLKNNP